MIGYISSQKVRVQRSRIRQAIARVDPAGLALRKERLHLRIKRRVYSVPHAHFMWHLDRNHKLIRWKFVVHAAIDGFSRACIYLKCSNNNRSDTVLAHFRQAVHTFDVIPTCVRTDHGGENVSVWQAMLESRSNYSHPAVLTGSSVHTQRIERFNRDLNINIRQHFGTMFYTLEAREILDVTNNLDIFSLHYVYLMRINNALEMFMHSHNNHKIRTESNMTPLQLLATSPVAADYNLSMYRVSTIATQAPIDSLIAQANPPIPPTDIMESPLSRAQMSHLLTAVPPQTEDNEQGMTVYTAVREYVHNCISQNQ